MKKTLVSGVSGFIGSHCSIELLKNGYQVRGTIRNLNRAPQLTRIIEENAGVKGNFELVSADLLDADSWITAVGGCDSILHVASPVPTSAPKNPDDLIIPARQGTLNVLKAAEKHKIKRVVLTSSLAAITYGFKELPKKIFTEEDWSNPVEYDTSAYILSKTLAEKAAWEFMDQSTSGMELVSINPGMVFGPALEKDFGSSLELIRTFLAGKYPGYISLGWPTIDVRDVAILHRLALENPEAAGHRFICENGYMDMKEVCEILYEHLPKYRNKIPTRRLPSWIIRLTAIFDKTARTVLQDLDKKREASHEKATKMLGWDPRSNKEAVIAAAESLIRFGVV